MRRSRRILLLTALVVVGSCAWFVPPQIRFLRAACGYAAKVACSAVFLGGRDLASVRAEELERFGLIDVRIDFDSRTATASAFGMVEATARARPGMGATLVHDPSRPLVPQRIALPAVAADEPEFDEAPAAELVPLVDEAFAEPDPEHPRRTHAIVVVHHGRIVAERYAPGFTRDRPQHGWSMSKTVLASLIGVLVGDGRIDLHAPAPVEAFRELHDGREKITVDQLLRMESGLRFEEDYEDPDSDAVRMLFGVDDMGDFAARLPIAAPPDTVRRYSSGTSLILSRMLRELLGDEAIVTFARDRLFEPLGMRSACIEFDPSGTPVASSYVWASPRDWARLGCCWLGDGSWRGRRILPEGFVRHATTPTPHGNGRFGAHVWVNALGDDGTRAWPAAPADALWAAGFDGQFMVVVPSSDLVMVRLGQTPERHGFDMGHLVGEVVRVLAGR